MSADQSAVSHLEKILSEAVMLGWGWPMDWVRLGIIKGTQEPATIWVYLHLLFKHIETLEFTISEGQTALSKPEVAPPPRFVLKTLCPIEVNSVLIYKPREERRLWHINTSRKVCQFSRKRTMSFVLLLSTLNDASFHAALKAIWVDSKEGHKWVPSSSSWIRC
jgi:hypothetical protein